MERGKIQVIWIPITPKPNCIIPSDGEGSPKGGTNIYATIPPNGILTFELVDTKQHKI